jgi:iron complex transport system substrate-binding protein
MIGKLLSAIAAIVLASSIARADTETCGRIVSLAPSVTELVFELGLDAHLVGVTRFCRYPPKAMAIEKVGGFFDVSVERLISLRPSLVVGLKEHEETLRAAKRFGIETLTINHSTVAGIRESFTALGQACGRQEEASAKLAALHTREEALKEGARSTAAKRALVVVGRTHEGSATSGLYVSGKDGYYSEVLNLVGLKNVNESSTIAIPSLSEEGVRALDPEVIIEIVNRDDEVREAPEMLWSRYTTLSAVREKRVFVLSQDFASIPGPRYIELAELLARLLRERDQARGVVGEVP